MSDYVIQKFPERLVKDVRFVRHYDCGKRLLLKKAMLRKGSEITGYFFDRKYGDCSCNEFIHCIIEDLLCHTDVSNHDIISKYRVKRKLIDVYDWFDVGKHYFQYEEYKWTCYFYIHSYTVNGEDKTEALLKAIADIGYDRMNIAEYKKHVRLLEKQAKLEALSSEIEEELNG